LLVSAVILGGGTHSGFFGDVFVELMAVLLLAVSAWRWFEWRALALRLPVGERRIVSGQNNSDQITSDQMASDHPGQMAADQVAASQITSGQITSGQITSGMTTARRFVPATPIVLPATLIVLIVLLAALQLLPLPAQIRALFSHALVGAAGPVIIETPAAGAAIGGIGTLAAGSWRALSLTPEATWAAALSFLAPAAIFAAVAQLDAAARLRLNWLILALGSVALLLGFLQIAQGPASDLRFFQITNPSEAVGFFANRNHFAAQLYVTLVFAAVWFISLTGSSLHRRAVATSRVLWFSAAAAFLIALAAGLAMARSRAGVILSMAAIVGIAAMVLASLGGGAKPVQASPAANSSRKKFGVRGIALATLGFAVLFAAQFGLHRVMTRFEADPLDDLRIPLTATTMQTVRQTLPFGTGLGSFVPVYASVEKSVDFFGGYANRAHNDYAEFLLEAGIPGALLMAIFFIWFLFRIYAIWLRKAPDQHLPSAADLSASAPSSRIMIGSPATIANHLLLQRAATIAVALVLAHSLADYPLRTTAMATIFAFACALLLPAPEEAAGSGGRHHDRRREPPLPTPSQASRPQPSAQTSSEARHPNKWKPWGPDIQWPDEWKKKEE